MRGIPGMKDFSNLPDSPLRGLLEIDGGNRCFAVAGSTVFEVFRDGTFTALLGAVGLNNHPVTWVTNGFQIAIASAGQLYMVNGLDGGAATVTPVYFEDPTTGDPTSEPVRAATVTFLNNYFIINQLSSKQIFTSNLAPDGGLWDPGDTAIKEGYPDNVAAVLADNQQLWLFGTDTTEVWQGSSDPFPFTRIQDAVLKIGCSAPYSVAAAGGHRFWLWNNVAYGAYGIDPQRISDSGVEQAWRGYADTTDAEGWCQIFGQHIFWFVSFPTAKRTWVYDFTHKCWHERGLWARGQQGIYHARVYCRAFGKDLCGDPQSGKIYEMSETTYTDADGAPLRRQRTADYVLEGMKNIRFSQLTVDADTGVGRDVAPDQPGYAPVMLMRYSDNRGKDWSSDLEAPMGQIGEDFVRIIFNQLGSSRIGKTFEVVVSDPIPLSIMGAYLKLSPPEQGR